MPSLITPVTMDTFSDDTRNTASQIINTVAAQIAVYNKDCIVNREKFNDNERLVKLEKAMRRYLESDDAEEIKSAEQKLIDSESRLKEKERKLMDSLSLTNGVGDDSDHPYNRLKKCDFQRPYTRQLVTLVLHLCDCWDWDTWYSKVENLYGPCLDVSIKKEVEKDEQLELPLKNWMFGILGALNETFDAYRRLHIDFERASFGEGKIEWSAGKKAILIRHYKRYQKLILNKEKMNVPSISFESKHPLDLCLKESINIEKMFKSQWHASEEDNEALHIWKDVFIMQSNSNGDIEMWQIDFMAYQANTGKLIFVNIKGFVTDFTDQDSQDKMEKLIEVVKSGDFTGSGEKVGMAGWREKFPQALRPIQKYGSLSDISALWVTPNYNKSEGSLDLKTRHASHSVPQEIHNKVATGLIQNINPDIKYDYTGITSSSGVEVDNLSLIPVQTQIEICEHITENKAPYVWTANSDWSSVLGSEAVSVKKYNECIIWRRLA